MTIRVVGFEVYKLLQRGVWLVLVCLLVKMVALLIVPEFKDSRIAISRRQYDAYMELYHGQTTPEKEAAIEVEYRTIKDRGDQLSFMRSAWEQGKIGEEEWNEYNKLLLEDEYKIAAISIFHENKNRFIAQQPYNGVPPAEYFYDYGWQTVFTIYSYPDIFMMVLLLAFSAQILCVEYASGAVGLLRSSRNGRGRLFISKTVALSIVLLTISLFSTMMEIVIFEIRFDLTESYAPLYSVAAMTTALAPMSVREGMMTVIALRTTGLLLLGLFSISFSVWLRDALRLAFITFVVALAPLLFFKPSVTSYTFTGLLAGTDMLREYTGIWPLLSKAIVLTIITAFLVFLSYRTYTNGSLRNGVKHTELNKTV